MRRYSCIVVDDEPLSREIIADFIADCSELDLVGQFPNAIEARTFLQQQVVDLIFLDINMPRLSGINFMKSLIQVPAVIFITAYSEYAVEGFDLEAVDYLLKPVSQERFLKAVGRFLYRMANPHIGDNYISVKADKKIYRLALDDILYVEAMGDYIRIVTTDRTLTVYDRFSNFAERLPASEFCRIHKSHLISLSKIDYLEGNHVRIGQTTLPVSNSYRNTLNDRLKN